MKCNLRGDCWMFLEEVLEVSYKAACGLVNSSCKYNYCLCEENLIGLRERKDCPSTEFMDAARTAPNIRCSCNMLQNCISEIDTNIFTTAD